jgi:hypothetical protein
LLFRTTAAAEGPRIVVLPFVTSDEELVIYGKPVADAVARGLRGLGEVTVGTGGDVGAGRADLVVELRIARARGKVKLEGTVRDAEVGQAAARQAARPVALSDLDQAAAELAKGLAKSVGDASTGRTQRQSDEKAAVTALPAVTAAPQPRQPDMRPAILVFQPDGQVAGGRVPFRDVTIGTLAKLLDGIGYRAILASRAGFVPPADAAREASAAHARATLMMQLHDVDFTWAGVLLARGTVHLVLVGAEGKVLINREIETDTLVGSRGDRHDALVRFIVAQAFDIARKEIGVALR